LKAGNPQTDKDANLQIHVSSSLYFKFGRKMKKKTLKFHDKLKLKKEINKLEKDGWQLEEKIDKIYNFKGFTYYETKMVKE